MQRNENFSFGFYLVRTLSQAGIIHLKTAGFFIHLRLKISPIRKDAICRCDRAAWAEEAPFTIRC